MTKDEIIALARLADVPEYDDDDCEDGVRFEAGITALVRFAEVVADAEREACAKLCEEHASEPMIIRYMRISDSPQKVAAEDCAALIRMRNKHD